MSDEKDRAEDRADSSVHATSPDQSAPSLPPTEGTLMEAMHIDIHSITAQQGSASMPVKGNLQPAGLLHGGASIALAETIGSYCAVVHARALYGADAQAVGTSVSATHHRSAREGTVTGTARALHLGRTVASYLVEVRDENERLLSTITVSTMVRAPRS